MGKFYFTCSFDDGDISDLRLADLLGRYNLKGTFYIPKTCELVSKSLSENQIKDLSGLVEIGGHTISHEVLTQVNNKKARKEIYNCKIWLENVTGKPVHTFCPPTGRFNKRHILFQQEAGFTSMRTVEMLSYFLDGKSNNGFIILPTTIQVYNHTQLNYLRNSIKRMNLTSYPELRKLYHPDWLTMSKNYLTYLRESLSNKRVDYYFHLWGHSWEIEKYSLWNSLELFLKEVSTTENMISCTNSELAEVIRSGKKNG